MPHMVGTGTSIAGAVAALVLAACSGSADPTTTVTVAPPTTTTTTTTAPVTTTVPPTTTTAAPTTTMAPPTTADPLARPEVLVSNVNRNSIDDFDTSKDNVYEAAMELRDLFVFLEGNPTDDVSEMIPLMFERGYPYWNPIMVGFLELTDNPGWHYSDPGVETLAIDLIEAGNDSFTVRFAHRRGTQTISDADGNIVKSYQGWDLAIAEYSFRRSSDGLWRYADSKPSVPAVPDDLLDMVPVEWTGRTQ